MAAFFLLETAISSFSHFNVISRLFQKWCSSGVVSAFPCRKAIDFVDFSRTFQDIAVAHE